MIRAAIQSIKKHPMAGIFALAVFARLMVLWAFPLPDISGGDFVFYDRAARSLAAGEGFGVLEIAPGWPLWLAFLYSLFGVHAGAAIFGQFVLGGALALGAYLFASELFPKKTAVLAGIAVALWPMFLIQTMNYGSGLLLYSVLLLFATFFFHKATYKKNLRFGAASGLLLGLGALTDVIALYLPVAFLAWAAVFAVRVRPHTNVDIILKQGVTALRQRDGNGSVRTWKERVMAFVAHAAVPVLVFMVVFSGAVGAWSHRNDIVYAALEKETGVVDEAPLIAKKGIEKEILAGRTMLFFSTFKPEYAMMALRGAKEMFLIPHDVSALDQYTAVSYKKALFEIFSGAAVSLSANEKQVLAAKIFLTLLHLAVLVLGGVGFALFAKKPKQFGLLAALVLGYVALAAIGYGLLGLDGFKSISPLSGFLLPLIPLFIIAACAAITTRQGPTRQGPALPRLIHRFFHSPVDNPVEKRG